MTTKHRLFALAAFAIVVLAMVVPVVPGATRFEGRYIGAPFSGYGFAYPREGVLEVSSNGSKFYASESLGQLRAIPELPKGGLEPSGTPYLGYFGTAEASVHRVVGEPSAIIVHLPSYGLWVATTNATEKELYRLGGRISYFGPSLALNLSICAGLVLVWPALMRWLAAVGRVLSRPIRLPSRKGKHDR